MQGLADSAGAGVQLGHHALDLLAQACLIQVDAKDVLAGVQGFQAAEVLRALLDFQRGHDGGQLCQQRIGRGLERLALVVDALDVAGIAGQHQRDQDQIVHIQAALFVGLDGLAEADGQLLGGIGGDALGRVGHERVGQAAVQHGVDEVGRLQHAGIDHHRHGLDVAHLGDQAADVLVSHLGADEGVAQQAAIDGHGGVQRVEAGAHLHLLDLVHRLAVGVHDAAQLQRGPAVGVLVLDDQVLGLLGVDEGGGEGVAVGNDGVVVLETVVLQHLLDLGVGARGDLVDHAPGIRDLALVLDVVHKARGHQAHLSPLFGVGIDAGLDLVAVVGAVVHALQGQGQGAGLIALVQQGGDFAHGELRVHAALEVGGVEAVALFGDGEGHHLQAGFLEDLDQAGPVVGELGVGLQALGDRGDDLLLDGAGGLQADQQAEVIVGAVSLVDDLIVEALGHDDAAVVFARIKHLLQDGRREGAEDVARAEVHPGGLGRGLGLDGLAVELGQLVAFFRPDGADRAVFNISQFHVEIRSLSCLCRRRLLLFSVQLVQHIPDAPHIHDAQGAVVQAVAGTDGAGALAPQVTAVVGADIALVVAVMVGLQDVQNVGVAVAVAVAGLREVAVGEVLDVADVGERDAVAVLVDDVGHVVVGVGVQAARAQGQAVVGVVHHGQEAVDVLGAGQQAGQAEDIPWGIVHVDGHLDVALMAHRHQGLQEVLQVLPQLFLGDGGVGLEQLVQLGHALRLPAGEGHVVLLGEAHDVLGHGLVVALDHVLLVVQGGGAVPHRVEQIGAGPVEDGHEVVADDLHAELGQVADGLDVVGDVLIAGRQADLDVVVDVDRLDHVHVEAVRLELFLDLGDLIDLPDLAGHLVVQGPDDAGDAGDLLDVGQGDLVVALAIPAETHLHWHSLSLLCAEIRAAAPCRTQSGILLHPILVYQSQFGKW